MKKLLAFLVILAAVFGAFNIATAAHDRDTNAGGWRDCLINFEELGATGDVLTFEQFKAAWYGLGSHKGLGPFEASGPFNYTDMNNDGVVSVQEYCMRYEGNVINPRG